MPLTEFKNKFGNIIWIVTAIGATITLIGYLSPVVEYASNLNKLVGEYEAIHSSLQKMEKHIDQYEEDRANKKKSFSVGLRSDTESGQMIYVDENNGIYRAFLDPTSKQYFYYDIDGVATFCYTKRPVPREERHIEIRPIITPDTLLIQNN